MTPHLRWLSLLLLLVIAAAGLAIIVEEGAEESTSVRSSVTYAVDGPLAIPGFDPAPNRTQVSADTVDVEIGSPTTVLDAARRSTPAVPIHLEAGGHNATHFVDPGSGRLITVAAPNGNQALDFGLSWMWRFEGHLAPIWPNGTWPAMLEISNTTLTLEQDGSIPAPNVDATSSWSPPPPSDGFERAGMGDHAPEKGSAELVTPMRRAIEGGREADPGMNAWLDEHPDWQLVAGLYNTNPGVQRMVTRSEENTTGSWELHLEASNGDRGGWRVEEENLGPEPVRQRAYTVEETAPVFTQRWAEPTTCRLIGYGTGADHMQEMVHDATDMAGVVQTVENRWIVQVAFGGSMQGDTEVLETVSLDLHDGHLHELTTPNAPTAVLPERDPPLQAPDPPAACL